MDSQKTIEEMKADFVVSVFDTINKQIQQTDLKTSIIISWDSIIAIMLGREIGQMVGGRSLNPLTILVSALCVAFLGLSGYFIFWTLRPRARVSRREEFTGLLYTGDILRLAKRPGERIKAYLQKLASITDPSEIHAQFVNSIVMISDISYRKNRAFQRSLLFTAISFGFLVILIAIVSVRIELLDAGLKAMATSAPGAIK